MLGDRRKSLEDQFFKRRDAELLAELRATQAREETRELMASASGVRDAAILDLLLDQGVTPATVAALSLVPLVAVAWADRNLDDAERRAVLQEVTATGMSPDSPGYELLESWLLQQPPPSLMTTWAEYAKALSASLNADQQREFRETLLRRAQDVAKAAGGVAGIGSKVSGAERTVLSDIESALSV